MVQHECGAAFFGGQGRGCGVVVSRGVGGGDVPEFPPQDTFLLPPPLVS